MADSMYGGIMEILTEYTHSVGRQVAEEAERLSKQAHRQLRETSPRSELTDVKHYADSWSVKKFGKSKTFRIVIHESTAKYRLTHLLENGFIHKPDKKAVRPQKHIEPVQEQLNREFEKAVERIINDT